MRWFCVVACVLWSSMLQAAPKVVTDIAPVHGIASAVMQGVAEPSLVLPQNADPHSYALRPSQARALQAADVVFWIGPNLTPWLSKSLETLAGEAEIVTLSDIEAITRLPIREGHDHDHGHDEFDPHLWLSPENAKQIATRMAEVLAGLDPENADLYQQNAMQFAASLPEVRSHQGISIIADHDAYQYLEVATGLTFLGAITEVEDAAPSAHHIAELREHVAQANCILAGPSTNIEDMRTVLGAADLPVAIVDPIGASIPLGANFYAQLMTQNIKALSACAN